MQRFTVGCIILVAGFLETLCEDTDSVNLNSSILEDPEPIKLLYGESHGISWTDVTSGTRQPPVLARKYLDVYSVDYHYKRNLVFFTGWGAVWRLPLDEAAEGAQGEQMVGDEAGASTLAVDWEHDRIYWTSPATGSVWRLGLDDPEEKSAVVIKTAGNLTLHSNVLVDPYMRYLFVATESGYSLRTDLEGDHPIMLNHGLKLTSLAVDVYNRKLYICGSKDFAPVLQSFDYEGENLLNYELQHGKDWWVRLISLDVFSPGKGQPPQLFWVHQGWRDRDTAWRINITDGKLSWKLEYHASGTLIDPDNRIWCVKVFHPDVQMRPEYPIIEERPVLNSSEAMKQGNLAVKSDASSFTLTQQCSLLFLACLALALFF